MLQHTFHIPVMRLSYTIDSPIKVAHLGINSVVSLGDDVLTEKARKLYAEKFSLPFTAIASTEIDARARRITAYLDMLCDVVEEKFREHQKQLIDDNEYLKKFLGMLPLKTQWAGEMNKTQGNDCALS